MSLFKPDFILLHAPSVYDFRKEPIMFGPISDVIPSTAVFEMYPVGFSAISEYLGEHGFNVRIINLAFQMLEDPAFDPERLLKKLSPVAFGIDLHWLPHAHGSLEVARLCKHYHPHIPVIFGGYSATYFHEELIQYPQVDVVVRGDSTEDIMLQLISAIKHNRTFDSIPGITYRRNGAIQINPAAAPVNHLDRASNNYLSLFKNSIKFGVKGFTPIYDWWDYPITAVMTCRGCTQNCVICGGSHYALKKFCNRTDVAYRSPELIVEDIRKICRYTRAPIFVVGDLRQPGNDYAHAILNGLRRFTFDNRVVLELFEPAPEEYFKQVSTAIKHFNFEISPESHDENIRKASGKFYSNKDMEASISAALDNGCEKFDIFFMIGVPRQTYQSVMETIDYCEYLMQRYDQRLNLFISPLAPFIDPGSIAYEESEKIGYRIFYRALEQYRQALLQPTWKHTLSYETRWMTRNEIADSTYEAALRLNRLKRKYGHIIEAIYRDVDNRIKKAIEVLKKIDHIMKTAPPAEQRSALLALKQDIDMVNESTLCHGEEINWPAAKSPFRYLNIIKDMLMGKSQKRRSQNIEERTQRK
jgi:B12-binding domain/radical SAM domain protein